MKREFKLVRKGIDRFGDSTKYIGRCHTMVHHEDVI